MGLAFSRSCGLVLASCFLLCSIETATGTGGMTHEGMYEVDLDSSILHVGSASSVRERILAIESDIVRGKGVASASAALEEAVKELRRGVAIERLSEQPTYADGLSPQCCSSPPLFAENSAPNAPSIAFLTSVTGALESLAFLQAG